MEIPLALVPLLTLNDNEAIKRICQLSGAEITLRQDMQHLGYSLAIITGTAQATALAKELLMQSIGLTGGDIITKELEVSGDPSKAVGAIEQAMVELRKKAMAVLISVLPPAMPGERGRIAIGPGPVAHVAVAETLLKKKLADAELDLCYRQGRPVPAGLKIPVLCKYQLAGSCSLAGKCQYCHNREELGAAQLGVAQRMQNPTVQELGTSQRFPWPPPPVRPGSPFNTPALTAPASTAVPVLAPGAPAAALAAAAAAGRTSATSALL